MTMSCWEHVVMSAWKLSHIVAIVHLNHYGTHHGPNASQPVCLDMLLGQCVLGHAFEHHWVYEGILDTMAICIK